MERSVSIFPPLCTGTFTPFQHFQIQRSKLSLGRITTNVLRSTLEQRQNCEKHSIFEVQIQNWLGMLGTRKK